MQPLTTSLHDCIEIYRRFQSELIVLDQHVSQGQTSDLLASMETLESLMLRIRETDQVLNQTLSDGGVSGREHPLFHPYLDLVREVSEAHRILLSKARAALSLLTSERAQLQGGRTAMAGYRPGREQRGGLLKNSC